MSATTQAISPKAPGALCHECPLASAPCVQTTRAHGVPRAAIVSRSPGKPEVLAGEHFASKQGSRKILDHLLNANGVQREEVLLTNVVLCVAPDGVVPPEAIKACAPRLEQELSDIPLIIAAGSEAVGLLVGRGKVDRHRGQRISRNGATVVATNNPAIVLQNDAKFPDLKRDFRRAFNPLPPATYPKVEVIEDVTDATAVLESVTANRIACDIESRGGLTHKSELISFQFAVDRDTAFVIGEREGAWRDTNFIDRHLRPFLTREDCSYIWHGGKFDTKILRHTYRILARVDHDTMLLSYALDERSGVDERMGVHGLDYLLMDTFGWPYYSSESIEKAKKTGVVEDYDEFYRYAGYDVGGCFQLFEHQLPLAQSDDVVRPYRHLLLRGTELAIGIELNGMIYDKERAADIQEFEVEPELRELEEHMQQLAQNPLLNPRSTKQMSHLLYDVWGISHAMQKRRPTQQMPNPQRSVDEAARKEIIQDRFRFHGDKVYERSGNMVKQVDAPDANERKQFYMDFAEKFDRLSKLQKQSSTYLVGMIKRADASEDSRIHTQLNFHTTNSGRLSSSKPNLQNITRTKEGLPDIRKLFVASHGRQIVQSDFSQAELRCIAQFSGDPELTRIYRDDLSLHKETATKFYGPNYTYEQYSTCKNVNFGVFYGQSAETFQEKHDIPKAKAQPYIDWVWKTFTGVAKWEDDVRREVKSGKPLVSPFGRKRRFHLLTRENIEAAFREGVNFYPQSTASDLTLCAGILLGGHIDAARAAIGIMVHDSIVADVQENYVDEYSTIITQIMDGIAKQELGWDLPFKAEVTIGPTWGEAA